MEEEQSRAIDRDDVFVSATQPILYHGCEYELYWMNAGGCFLLCLFLFAALPLPTSLFAVGGVVGLFFVVLYFLRVMAKADPMLRKVYKRHLLWPDYLPPLGKMLKSRNRFKLMTKRK